MMENKIEELEKQLENIWEEAREKAGKIKEELKREKEKNALSLKDVTGRWFKVDFLDDDSKLVKTKLCKVKEQEIDETGRICLEAVLIEEYEDLGFQIYLSGIEGKLVSVSGDGDTEEFKFTLDYYDFPRVFTEIAPETGLEEIEGMYERTIRKLKSC